MNIIITDISYTYNIVLLKLISNANIDLLQKHFLSYSKYSIKQIMDVFYFIESCESVHIHFRLSKNQKRNGENLIRVFRKR